MKPYYEHKDITIYNCDCRDILPDLPKVDLVLTDPPYGIGFADYESHDDDPVKYPAFIWECIEGAESLIECGFVVVFQAAKNCHQWNKWFPRDWRLIAIPKSFVQIYPVVMQWATDYCLMWKIGKPYWKTNKVRDWYFSRQTSLKRKDTGHPCPRPDDMMRYLVASLSQESNTILDPFMGSGTTLVAAKNLGRKAIGIEIEEKYCEIAVQRLAQNVLDL